METKKLLITGVVGFVIGAMALSAVAGTFEKVDDDTFKERGLEEVYNIEELKQRLTNLTTIKADLEAEVVVIDGLITETQMLINEAKRLGID